MLKSFQIDDAMLVVRAQIDASRQQVSFRTPHALDALREKRLTNDEVARQVRPLLHFLLNGMYSYSMYERYPYPFEFVDQVADIRLRLRGRAHLREPLRLLSAYLVEAHVQPPQRVRYVARAPLTREPRIVLRANVMCRCKT